MSTLTWWALGSSSILTAAILWAAWVNWRESRRNRIAQAGARVRWHAAVNGSIDAREAALKLADQIGGEGGQRIRDNVAKIDAARDDAKAEAAGLVAVAAALLVLVFIARRRP
jgi:recombinational DNA repair ATPase RecF